MSKRSIAITFVIALFVLLAFSIVYVFSELYTESDIPIVKAPESQKFKEEFEKLNNVNDLVKLDIPVNNPFLVKELKDINALMENKETFYVFFASPDDQKARLVLDTLIESAQDNGVKKIYYVNINDDLDEYSLDKKNKLVKTKEGSEEYKKSLSYFDLVLDTYKPLTYIDKKGKEKSVAINEKRIYTPVLIKVINGEVIDKEYGLTEVIELTNKEKCNIKEKYNCLFKKEKADYNVCEINTICN